MTIKGQFALVTGSSRGIGRGIALKLAENGAKVGINYRVNEGAAQETLRKVREIGTDGFIIQADVSRPEDVSTMFAKAEAEFGSLDIYVSNAIGDVFSYYQPPMETTPDKLDMAFNSQAKAFLLGCQESARLMRNGGRIVAVTYNPGVSTGGWQSYVAQSSAKAALQTLVRHFAVALAKQGITVNALSPGITDDTVLNAFPEEVQTSMRDWHESGWTPMGRLGTPADIGNAVALLCSEEANWITGQVIAADGGQSLMNSDFPLEIQLG